MPDNMPERFIRPLLLVMSISLAIWVIFRLVSRWASQRTSPSSRNKEALYFVFYMYVVSVLCLTIIPLPFLRFNNQNQEGINLVPVVNMIKSVVELFFTESRISKEHAFQNLVGNVIMFVPLGIFLPLVSQKYLSVRSLVIAGCICSVSIELSQLILRQLAIYRTVDIDDVILNTTGAYVGFRIVQKFYFRRNSAR